MAALTCRCKNQARNPVGLMTLKVHQAPHPPRTATIIVKFNFPQQPSCTFFECSCYLRYELSEALSFQLREQLFGRQARERRWLIVKKFNATQVRTPAGPANSPNCMRLPFALTACNATALHFLTLKRQGNHLSSCCVKSLRRSRPSWKTCSEATRCSTLRRCIATSTSELTCMRPHHPRSCLQLTLDFSIAVQTSFPRRM